MRYTQHTSNNRVLGAGNNPNCGALPITDTELNDVPAVASFWLPDADELKLLNEGKPVVLFICGHTHAPVYVGVAKER